MNRPMGWRQSGSSTFLQTVRPTGWTTDYPTRCDCRTESRGPASGGCVSIGLPDRWTKPEQNRREQRNRCGKPEDAQIDAEAVHSRQLHVADGLIQ